MLSLVLVVASTFQLAIAEPAPTTAVIPIDGPITISQSGDYIVTKDFSGNPAIQFSTSATATIDFDGHRVEGSIILRRAGEVGPRLLTIKNGEFQGSISAVTNIGHGSAMITMDSMTLTSVGGWLEDASFVATHCRFDNLNVTTDANFEHPLFQLEDSEVISGGISGWGSRVWIVGNDIWNGSILLPDSDGFGTGGLIAGNVLHNGDVIVGERVDSSSRLQLVGNDISGHVRLRDTNDSVLYGNVIRGCFTNGNALTVDGVSRRNQIVRNDFLGGCDHGIYFGNTTRDNVYTDNEFLFPVPQPIVDDGENNHRGPSVDVGPE
jgi:hypothetical protein